MLSVPVPPSELVAAGEAGMTTAEYAVGTLAACAFAVLITVVRSPVTPWSG